MNAITFYSYKGGVGRSLALSNVASRLAELGKSVCVIDFDLEAPGLHFKFPKFHKIENIEKGIVDYIYAFNTEGKMPESIKDFSIELKPKNKATNKITMIPAGNIKQSDYWHKLSKINWSSLFYKEESEGLSFFLDLKERIKKEIKPDFLLIDSRTGITDIAGITLRILANQVVILAANNEENKEGSIRIIKSLLNKENALFNETPKINFVLTRLPFTNSPQDKLKETRLKIQMIDQLKRNFPDVDIPLTVIRSDRRLEENEQQLIGDEKEMGVVSIENDYLDLFELLCGDKLDPKELINFNNKVKAEKIYHKALTSKDETEKIELLNKAIDLYKDDARYYDSLAYYYADLKNYKKAIEMSLIANKLDNNNASFKNNLGFYYSNLENYEKAITLYNEAIAINSQYPLPYRNKAITLRKLGRIDEAIEIYDNFLTNINPNDTAFLNSRADLLRTKCKLKEAYADIYKAIEIDESQSVFYGTLAEICFDDNKMNEFYMNLSIALQKGITADMLKSAKDVYEKVKDEPRFIELLERYNIDIEEVLA
jgi:tetratricopeptide (TPR) repeat protein/MinD-like ATPase involved in chromosome partitioning or flagellar assembly